MEFLQTILEGICQNPTQIKIEKTTDWQGTLLTVNVAPEDMGRVLGKGGATIMAIRTLVRIWGIVREERLNIKVSDPPGFDRNAVRPKRGIDEVLDDLG